MAVKFVGAEQKVLKDKRVKKFRDHVRKLRQNDKSEDYKEEMRSMHVTRRERRATAAKLIENAQRDLIDMLMRNQSIRSRVLEMKMEIFNVSALIEDHLAALTQHILITYQAEVAQVVGSKTKGDREGFVKALLAREVSYMKKLQVVIKIADMLIDDLDQAGWAVQRTTAVLTLTAGRGRNV